MALGIELTRMLPLYPHGVFLQWDLTGATESGNYVFEVSRSGSEDGPWQVLRAGLINTYNYLDRLPTQTANDPNQLILDRFFRYRVSVVGPTGQSAQVVDSVEPRLKGRQFLIRRKMLRDAAVMLKKLNGVEVAVLKRRHWGPRCTKCFDKYSKEVVRGACTACYGTGFTGGYYEPIITWAKRSPTQGAGVTGEQGKVEAWTASITMLDLPVLEEDDLLVFLRDNRRFIVKDSNPTELQTVTVHQRVNVSEIARNDIIYRIPVDPLRVPPLF